jgi:predicted pyridoxine 5'-phosphate oxidase superfamily flavin-nucleotide-binding protein
MKKTMPDKNFKGVVVIKVEKVFDIKSGPTAGELIVE